MSCDHELANEWAGGSGENASYVTKSQIKDVPEGVVRKSSANFFEKTLLAFMREFNQ